MSILFWCIVRRRNRYNPKDDDCKVLPNYISEEPIVDDKDFRYFSEVEFRRRADSLSDSGAGSFHVKQFGTPTVLDDTTSTNDEDSAYQTGYKTSYTGALTR